VRRITVEIVSVGPPCLRCEATKLNVERVLSRLGLVDIALNMVDAEKILGRYGVVVSPSLVVNGSIKTMGRIPKEDEVENILKEAMKQSVLHSPTSEDEGQD